VNEHTTHHDDCGCLSARYEARIAALEAELAEAREHAEAWESEADSANTLGQSWMAHANDLRGALERVRNTAWIGGNEGMRSMCQEALAATPAASLSALKAEVLERAAKYHDAEADAAMLGPFDAPPEGVTPIQHAGLIAFHRRAARAIRALAAQEVKND